MVAAPVAPRQQHIAILDCERNVPAVQPKYGEFFSGIFTSVFEQAASRLQLATPIKYSGWDVVNGQLPDPATVDAIIVSGSMAGAYDTYPWIAPLAALIETIYTQYPHVRIAGVCFGHQIVCQTLLGKHGVYVEPHPGGFEFGLQTVTVNPRLEQYWPGLKDYVSLAEGPSSPPKLRLQLGHGDHVVLPPDRKLPGTWMDIGSSAHCSVQGLFEPGRVLTMQPHFECDDFIMGESFRHLFTADKGFSKAQMDRAIADTQGPHDSLKTTEWVLQFLLGTLPTEPAVAEKVE